MQDFFKSSMHGKMHARDLLQLSCLLAIQPPDLSVKSKDDLEAHLALYWSSSRDRLDRWQFYLPHGDQNVPDNRQQPSLDASEARDNTCQSRVVSLIAEMIVSEPLTRVWAAILSCSNQRNPQHDMPPQCVAEHIVSLHSALRQTALSQLDTKLVDSETQQQLHSLAECTLRWTDLLLAHIEQSGPVSRFAPNSERCLDFAEDLRGQLEHHQQTAAALTIKSARKAICDFLPLQAFSGKLNFHIGASVLQSYRAGDLDSWGLADPLCAVRLLSNLSQCEGLIEASLHEFMPMASSG